MTEFFRYPHTPHLAWLGRGVPRDDKTLTGVERATILSRDVVVEEKVDGANIGISVDDDGELLVQNRGAYIDRTHPAAQFRTLFRWLDPHRDALVDALWPDLILFGEWCYAVHSVEYTKLPDWFLAFDVYDRVATAFWNAPRRDEVVSRIGLRLVPRLATGHFELSQLVAMLGPSRVSDRPMEGIVVRSDDGDRNVARAKLVATAFTQQIEAHWSRRALRRNTLARPR